MTYNEFQRINYALDQGNQVGAFVVSGALIRSAPTSSIPTRPPQLLGKSVRIVRFCTTRGIKLPNGERWYLPVKGLDHRQVQLFDLADIRTVANAVRGRGTSHKLVLIAACPAKRSTLSLAGSWP